MTTILIATTNPGKFKEYMVEFADLPFKFVNLKDVRLHKTEIDEPFTTPYENAIHKARFFAKKSGLPTLSDDTGLFIKALEGAPGVKARRFGATPEECRAKVLRGLSGVPAAKRTAYFETVICFYNPKTDATASFHGRVNGLIAKKEVKAKPREGMMYDSIFYYPPFKKTFAEVPATEKNLVSHRGQAALQMKYFLGREYGPTCVVVAGAILVKNRRMFMQKRRDPRPEFNNTWELPGGIMENGEQVKEAIRREVKEETGYSIRFIEPIPLLYTHNPVPTVQVYLYTYICSITGGSWKPADGEVAGHGWFTYAEALKEKLLGNNPQIFRENKTLLKKYID